jgi:hypothetical protein
MTRRHAVALSFELVFFFTQARTVSRPEKIETRPKDSEIRPR